MRTPAVQRLLKLQRAQAGVADERWYERIYDALVRGLSMLPAESWHRLAELLDLNTLWALLVVLGIWGGAQFTGLGEVADLGLLAYGLFATGESIFKAGSHLWHFTAGALNAKTDDELDQAGAHFAAAVGEIGITALEAFLGGKAFRLARATIVRVRPVPKGFGERLSSLKEWVRRHTERLSDEQRERLKAAAEAAQAKGIAEATKNVKDAGGWLGRNWYWLVLGGGGLLAYHELGRSR